MKNKVNLKVIFDNDTYGVLNIQTQTSNIKTEESRLIESFEEINDFVDKYKRTPTANFQNLTEHRLYSRLNGILGNINKVEILKRYDRNNLLTIPTKEILSVDDIFNDDIFEVLDRKDNDIFTLKNIKSYQRSDTDFVARRKPISDFSSYEKKFKEIQSQLKTGEKILVDFKGEDSLQEGGIYVQNGVLFILEKFTITRADKYLPNGKRIRRDGRTRCIFENGTESDMLLRSVAKALYANGKVVIDSINNRINQIEKANNGINQDDKETGYIYILKSLSTNPEVQSIDNLYKVGFSETTVEERIKNSETDPTYLMAPVRIISTFKVYNINPQKLEQLLHRFFGSSCLNIDIVDSLGKRHSPREWFIAPVNVIETAIKMIINGDIINYRYDQNTESII